MEDNYFEEFEEMEAEKGMTVVACYPGKTAQVIEIDGSLESMQQFVGGYIEAVYPFDDPVAIICNEEGKLNGLPLNRALYNEDGEMFDIIAGTFFVCYAPADSESYLSLPEELLAPRFGVYACKATVEENTYPAVTNIGTRPTVNGQTVNVETHLLDFARAGSYPTQSFRSRHWMGSGSPPPGSEARSRKAIWNLPPGCWAIPIPSPVR